MSNRITITVGCGSQRATDDIGLEDARRWAAYRLAECGRLDMPEDGDPEPSGIDDETVVQMIADDIGANLDYEKLR